MAAARAPAAGAAPTAEGGWPVWTVPVGIVAGATLGQIAAFAAIVPLALAGAGDGDITGTGLLLSSLGFGAAMLATIALLVRRTEPLSIRALGLQRVAPAPALVWALLGGALIGAFVFFWAHVADLSDVAGVPSELDSRSSVAEALGIGEAPKAAPFGVDAVASALGRVSCRRSWPRSCCAASRWRRGDRGAVGFVLPGGARRRGCPERTARRPRLTRLARDLRAAS